MPKIRIEDHRDHGDRRNRGPGDVAVADGVLEHRRNFADIHASGDDLCQPQGAPECAQGDDQRRHLGFGDEDAVEETPAESAADGDEDADNRRAPPVPPMACMAFAATTPEKTRFGANGQVDARGDNDEGHPDAENAQDGDVLDDLADIAPGREASGARAEKIRKMTSRTSRIWKD